MSFEALPSRRDEAWKYSDLRAALRGVDLPPLRDTAHPIARLAQSQTRETIAAGDICVLQEDWDGPLNGSALDARARQIVLEEGARAVRIVRQRGGGVALGLTDVQVAAGASFTQFAIVEGAHFARLETTVRLTGAGAHATLNGVYMVGDGRHADFTHTILHEAPDATTRQTIKGVVRAGGKGVFQGKIHVGAGALKTDAQQHHDALLLDEGAEVFAKPELEIFADDVQCAHGNTVGALDEAALFYMRARGIAEARARALLIEAFLSAAIPEDLPDAMAQDVRAHITAWLEAAP